MPVLCVKDPAPEGAEVLDSAGGIGASASDLVCPQYFERIYPDALYEARSVTGFLGAIIPSSSLPASASSTEHFCLNNGTSFSTIAQTRASSTVGYSWVSWLRKSTILQAFVIASKISGATRERAAMASPMMSAR